MKNIWVVFKREVQAYFLTPLAYVFIFIFLILSMSLCFVFGRFLEGEDASLDYTFFQFHPWLFMVLGPAIGMRLWSEENREGTIELLLTMPISTWQAIIGKFLAACLVLVSALAMTAIVALRYLATSGFFAWLGTRRWPDLHRGLGPQIRREIGWSLASA